jgi:hypothetical protein
VNREEALMIWAPQNSLWSSWTKPVLFSFMSDPLPEQAASVDHAWNAETSRDTAIIVELLGAETVVAGLHLARFGYRPVPLFNACPLALDIAPFEFPLGEPPPLVDVASIVHAMESYTSALGSINLPDAAPPAFLLDANRSQGPLFPPVGAFDNRSIVRESDLPNGEELKRGGIRRVILVRETDTLACDLYRILRSWQSDGLQVQTQAYAQVWSPVDYVVKSRNPLSDLLDKVLMWVSFRTNSLGSFGRTIHLAGGSGG